jgi:hypothetical protein
MRFSVSRSAMALEVDRFDFAASEPSVEASCFSDAAWFILSAQL